MVKVLEDFGLSFDDVLLLPRKSSVVSRREISTTTRFAGKIMINIPIASAAMDTVTESAMAITLAREGGIGVIHRFIPPERQAEEVAKVKRADNVIIEKPTTISPDKTVGEARELMKTLGISGLLVVDSENRLLGILTKRDVLFEDDKMLVSKCMTPRSSMVIAESDISIEEAKNIFRRYKVEKIPIVDKDNRVKGLITCVDLLKREAYPNASRDPKGRLMVAAAIGVKENEIYRAKLLIEAGADAIVIDVA
ncbi:MAG: IMP dehydrogenase, partial [Nitrososphaerota archaeon]